jgi:hypothetical protein
MRVLVQAQLAAGPKYASASAQRRRAHCRLRSSVAPVVPDDATVNDHHA